MKFRLNLFLFGLPLMLAATSIAAAPSPTVRVSEVRELTLGEPITVNGAVRARTDVVLPATLDGELQWVAEEGDLIEPGGVVARLDARQLVLQKSEQQLLAKRARINLDYLAAEAERLAQLQISNLTSRTQVAEMVSRRDLAANDLAVAESRIAQLDEQLGRTRIVAPVEAVIAERLIASGEFARRGDGVVRIVDPRHLEVVITIPLTYLGRVEQGGAVRVLAGDALFDSEIGAIIPAGSPTSQTFIAIARVPGSVASMVVAGQFAAVDIPLSSGGLSLFVPRDAIVLRTDGSYVYRIDENNIANRVVVRLGEGQGDMVAVSGKLAVGDTIAVRGVERLTDGQAVTPTRT